MAGGRDQEILSRAERFFVDFVRPRAQEIDASPAALREALDEMSRQGLMALRRPESYGGPAISEPAFRSFQEMSARYSGSLSFLMTQHQSAVSMLAKSENEPLKADFLPRMDGELRSGIGFSQLRRPGPPILRASPEPDGYRLDGTVPWITGMGFFDWFLVGATLPDGSAVYGFVPLSASKTLAVGDPMRLAAMESPQTVAAELAGHPLPAERVVFVKPAGWAQRNDMINIVLQGHFALGCAQAGIDNVRSAMERRPHESLRTAAETLEEELGRCREAASAIPSDIDSETTREKLEIRAWAIELAVRCAHAGVVAWGGAANSLSHPAQRVYREALVYSVSAQTSDIMAATLERLALRTR